MAHELKQVTIYTDGACIGNPGPGGYGVILKCGERKKELSGGFRLTTSNRMLRRESRLRTCPARIILTEPTVPSVDPRR